jgi:hypothetical protein
VHVKHQKSADDVLALGLRISFIEGDPRTPTEMPAALDIEIVPMPPALAKAVAAQTKPEENPSSEVKS